jgi:hypothetical protein
MLTATRYEIMTTTGQYLRPSMREATEDDVEAVLHAAAVYIGARGFQIWRNDVGDVILGPLWAHEVQFVSATTLEIRLDDCTDWGQVKATDEDRDAYEQAVADAIAEAYPGATVTVQCLQIARPRAVVTTRDADGRIRTDVETARREEAIGECVIAISRDVWEGGEFWPATEGVQS